MLLVEIKFEYEVQRLLLLSYFPDSWSGTLTTISSSAKGAKLTFEGILSLILGEDVNRQSIREASSSLRSTKDKGKESNRGGKRSRNSKSKRIGRKNNRKDITCWNYKHSGHLKNQCSKPMEYNGQMETNMVSNFQGDTLICSDENAIEMWVLDSGASLHPRHSKDVA